MEDDVPLVSLLLLQEMTKPLIDACMDVDLLDLIYKMLIFG